jgi:hypothetical protein
MLWRFCLYGFLKNQKYYEPFLVLFFLEKGLSYTLIGALLGFREICINLMEFPSGALADLYGPAPLHGGLFCGVYRVLPRVLGGDECLVVARRHAVSSRSAKPSAPAPTRR